MRVAIGIIFDQHRQVLITRRSLAATHPGYWEFPGGKLETGETAEAALHREILEEVGLRVLKRQFLGEISHNYDHHVVTLVVFLVEAFEGEPICSAQQIELRWVPLDKLGDFNFPEANDKIVAMIQR
jgi:8-oxo-dGTP diphosphatase